MYFIKVLSIALVVKEIKDILVHQKETERHVIFYIISLPSTCSKTKKNLLRNYKDNQVYQTTK